MVSNKITEGVGKKIVEALKQQSDIEINKVVENTSEEVIENENTVEALENSIIENDEPIFETEYEEPIVFEEPVATIQPEKIVVNETFTTPVSFSQQIVNNTQSQAFASGLDDFDLPTNVAVLRQLINQLPAGVSKQTGAQIIKQTMEALGISMKSVLQEAQQVQENLNISSRECQASILEYKKQISLLENKSQKLQRQASALNDIISLFVQTSI